MRLVSIALGLLGALAPVMAVAADLATVSPLAGAEIVLTRQAGAFVRHETAIDLQPGENRFALDFARLGLDPASVRLTVIEPRSGVTSLGRETPADEPGVLVWRLQAQAAGRARLRLTYALKGLETAIHYQARLQPAAPGLQLQALLSVTNNSKLELPQARVTVGPGQQIITDLRPGQTVQQPLFTLAPVPYETRCLYDVTRFKDTVRMLLVLPRSDESPASRQALLAGKLRVQTPAEGGLSAFVGEAALPYVPPGEKVEINLGVVPEVTVVRTKLKSEQTNVRSDVYKKLALYDLVEDWQLEFQHHRPGPITLVVHERFAGDWELLKQSHPAERIKADTAEFVLTLPPGEKLTLTYTSKRLNVEP